MITVLKQKMAIGERDILYSFECPEIAGKAKPGQFVEIRISGDTTDPFLRRPVSIFDATDTELRLLVRKVGKGTAQMAEWEPGTEIDMIGPLGNGFKITKDANVLLVGGGIGAAPLYYLAKILVDAGKDVTMLFSPKRDQVVLESFGDLKNHMHVLYSENRKQLPKMLQNLFQTEKIDVVYTCGPNAMMKSVAQKAQEANVPSQVSLEAKMGCGFGICVGCVVPIKTSDNDFEYKRVCHDGPVFLGEEVIFE